jgi:mono/diheme cytochrome c family protein
LRRGGGFYEIRPIPAKIGRLIHFPRRLDLRHARFRGAHAPALVLALLLAPIRLVLGAGADSKPAAAPPAARVSRGKYLVTLMGCNDCHTPWKMGANGPEPDMSRMLSGHPESMGKMPPAPPPSGPWMASIAATFTSFSGPFGTTYAINLTPDQNTGIGIWTEDMFVKSLKTGKHMGTSRPIMPPMPWIWYRNATDQDLKAIYAYLRTIPPIANRVPDYEEPRAAPAAPANK